MQTLGLSESTPKPETRLKALFWPRVRYPEDVDILGVQGYWVCIILAAFTWIGNLSGKSGPAGLIGATFYYLAGVGIRRSSRFAAASAFLIYLLSVIAGIKVAHSAGVASIFFLALLLSNVRATWLAKSFAVEYGSQQPETGSILTSRSIFNDVLPRLIWPIGRWFYYGIALLMLVGVTALIFRTSPSLNR